MEKRVRATDLALQIKKNLNQRVEPKTLKIVVIKPFRRSTAI